MLGKEVKENTHEPKRYPFLYEIKDSVAAIDLYK